MLRAAGTVGLPGPYQEFLGAIAIADDEEPAVILGARGSRIMTFHNASFREVNRRLRTHSLFVMEVLPSTPLGHPRYQLCEVMRIARNTVWIMDHETENAFALLPEMLEEKRIWATADDDSYSEEQYKRTVANLITVVEVSG